MTHAPQEAVIRISYQSSLGQERGAVFETYVPLSADAAHIDAIMDKLRIVCDRQSAIARTADIERAIASDKANLEALVADMRRVETHQLEQWNSSGRRGEFQLTKAEAEHRRTLEGSIINRKKSIELLEAQLTECRAVINGAVDNASGSKHG